MKKELGKWLMDVAKYSVTAGLLSYWFKGIEGWPNSSFLLAVLFIFVLLCAGLLLVSDKRSNKRPKKATGNFKKKRR